MEEMMGFVELGQNFKDLIKSIGIQKQEIESIVSGGSATAAKQKAILDKLDTTMKNVQMLMANTEVTEQERKRRIAELESEISKIDLFKDFEPDLAERMRLNRELNRLNAKLGTWQAMDVFHFETLLDPESQEDFKTLLEEADKDIKARQNLQRVLKGVEIVLRVAAFGAALAAKLAVA
jgi:hypothetical protein